MTIPSWLRMTVVAAVLCALPAWAERDSFGLGNGQDGLLDVTATVSVNRYAKVTGALAVGATTVAVDTVTGFAAGDLVMVLQTTGPEPAPNSEGSSGSVDLSSSQVGQWELARVASVAGSSLTLTAPLYRAYAANVTQVIFVPEYTTVSISGAGKIVPGNAWNGATGGIVAFLANGGVNNTGSIDVSGQGFRGGGYSQDTSGTTGCTNQDEPGPTGQQRGESVVLSAYGTTGYGKVANGGGGGICKWSGGGGGGHGGAGGRGGWPNDGFSRPVGGIGGGALTYPLMDRMMLGGGAGAGHGRDPSGAGEGHGGGAIFIRAQQLAGTGKLLARGADSRIRSLSGAGGGGAGGTISLRVVGTSFCGGLDASGGKGGDTTTSLNSDMSGPGGGGGGGRILFQASAGSNCTGQAPGGPRGTAYSFDPWLISSYQGASKGDDGAVTQLPGGLRVPTVPMITAPAQGSTTSNSKPPITGTAQAGSQLYLYLDGVQQGPVALDAAGNFSFTPGADLAAGSHQVQAASESDGLWSPLSSVRSFTVDTTPPATTLDAPANGAMVTTTTPVISGTAEAGSTVEIQIDGAPAGTTTSTVGTWRFTPAALAQGSHTVKARSVDEAGNEGPFTAENAFTVDSEPPAVPVVLVPTDGALVKNTRPTLSGTGEAGSTVSVIIDGASVGSGPVAASDTWSLASSTSLTDGAHVAYATARDAAGNTSAPSASINFQVDATPPPVPSITFPTNGQVLTNRYPTLTGTAEAGSTVTVVLDGQEEVTTASSSGAWSFTRAQPLDDKTYTLQVKATDAAGNSSALSAVRLFSVDATPPAPPEVTAPAQGQVVGTGTPALSGKAEAGAAVTVLIDGGFSRRVTASGAGTWSTTVPTLLASTSHTVQATAQDAAGNTSLPSGLITFMVDTVPPPAPVVTAPANHALIKDTKPTIAGTAEAGSTVEIFFDAKPVPAGKVTVDARGDWVFPSTVALADGQHEVRVRAIDSVNNVGSFSSISPFTVDATPPAAPSIGSPANGASVGPGFSLVTGTAEPNSTVTVELDGSGLPPVTADGLGRWSCIFTRALLPGAHTVKAWATDAAGNASPLSAATAFILDDQPPEAPKLVTPEDGKPINTPTPPITGTAEAGSTLRVFLNGVAQGDSVQVGAAGSWSFTLNITLGDGRYEVKAQATDQAGNLGPFSAIHAFIVDTRGPGAPEVKSPREGEVVSTGAPVFTGLAEPGSTVSLLMGTIVLGTAPVDALGAWSLKPATAFPEGTWSLQARATDAAGNEGAVSAARSFRVDMTAPEAPQVLEPTAGQALRTQMPTFTGTAEPGSTVTLFLDGVELGRAAAGTTGAWSWTAQLGMVEGPHTVRAQATDTSGRTGLSSGMIPFTVDTMVPDTFLTGGSSGQTEQREATFELSSSEAAVSYECRLDGAAFAPCSSPVTFLELAEGEHTLEVRARDAAGNEDPTPARHSWSVVRREMLEGGGVGCSTPGGAAALAPLGWLGLAWLLSRRRRD